jgi:hypothetical protein
LRLEDPLLIRHPGLVLRPVPHRPAGDRQPAAPRARLSTRPNHRHRGVFLFPDAASARIRYEYLRGFQAPFGDSYDYLSGTAILRLSQYLTPAQAHAYRAAFVSAAAQH